MGSGVSNVEGARHRRLPAVASVHEVFGSIERTTRVPVLNRQFWMVQALIAAVTACHIAFEYVEPSVLGAAYFVPASLYLFPVLYASFNFGLEGALPTAFWSAALSAPDIVLNHHGMARLGEAFQVGTILLLSTLVAIRVDKERAARRASERLQRERELSEKKYRSLFENAGDAILVVDRDGNVQEANAAAERLGVDPARREARITEQLGPNAAEIERFIRGEGDDAGDVSVTRPDGAEVWLQPVFATIEGVEHAELVQVLLRDVTDRHGFQHYVQEIVRAQEDERARIAHELHDVSVQSAILICRQLDEASSAVGADDGAAIGAMLIEARHSAEAMADELRRFSRDLRPLILEDLGFVPALRRLVNELRERSQIHLRCDIHGQPRRLDPRAELMLFRIGQEALRNAEHHASPLRISLSLSFESGAVRLRVSDNGTGFVVPPLTVLLSGGSLGLLGMQQRARLVGGWCQVRSRPGEGTVVTAEVPG